MSESSDSNIQMDLSKIFTDLAAKIITDTASSAFSKGKGIFKNFSNDISLT